jgi:hypothetical protein
MKLRTLMVLVVLLLAAEAALRWREAHRQRNDGTAFVDRPLLELSEIQRAHRIVVREKPQSKTVDKGDDGYEVRLIVDKDAPIRETVLEKRGENEWVVANRFNLEADPEWLGQTLRDLTQGRLVRFVASDPSLMNDLGLELGQVRLEDEHGQPVRRFDFGRKDGGETYQFVRVDNADAFVAKHETEIVGDPLTWVAGRVLKFELADIRELELPFQNAGEAPLRLQRAKRGEAFQAATEADKLDEAAERRVEKLVSKLIDEPLAIAIAPSAEAAKAARGHVAATLRLSLFDGRTYRIDYAVVPKNAAGIAELLPYDDQSIVFAFYECSDAKDLSVKQSSRAALGYNRNSILGRLPANRAALNRAETSPGDAAPGAQAAP